MNNIIDEKIINLINEHHILTLATSVNNIPYCCTCFYVYSKEMNSFIFTSDKTTKHVKDISENNKVAAAIALETSMVGKIRGLQICGIINELDGNNLKKAQLSYLKKFPFAILKELTLWSLEPNFIKMTDNRLGFGKKIFWNKNDC